MPSGFGQIEVALGYLFDGDCNSDSELEEEQTEIVVMEAWKILNDDSELALQVVAPC